MEESAQDIRTWRRRVAQLARRAEACPGNGAVRLQGDVAEILAELKRLGHAEPHIVLDVLFLLLDRLVEVLTALPDGPAVACEVVASVAEQIRHIVVADARTQAARVDHARAVDRLVALWHLDEEGWFSEFDALLLEISRVSAAASQTLRGVLRKFLASMPLIFPPPLGATDDLERALAIADRHRTERLLGEVLAHGGQFEYAVIVARDHWRRTGDALDVVSALRRAGRTEEAVTMARHALASPRSYQRGRLQELLDAMMTDAPVEQDRTTRRTLERQFLSAPTRSTYEALERAVPKDQWKQVRQRVLGHAQKHQKAPTLVFQLYLEAGEIVEADGLVVVQPVDPDVLSAGAREVAQTHPNLAAGWLLCACHHRMAQRAANRDQAVLKDLLLVRDLANDAGQTQAFERAFRRFRTRYSRVRGLVRLLDEAGL